MLNAMQSTEKGADLFTTSQDIYLGTQKEKTSWASAQSGTEGSTQPPSLPLCRWPFGIRYLPLPSTTVCHLYPPSSAQSGRGGRGGETGA